MKRQRIWRCRLSPRRPQYIHHKHLQLQRQVAAPSSHFDQLGIGGIGGDGLYCTCFDNKAVAVTGSESSCKSEDYELIKCDEDEGVDSVFEGGVTCGEAGQLASYRAFLSRKQGL